jgi:ubiquitin C-terminal hydrolase
MSRQSTDKKQAFIGLSNQGATCYMNSLLQTLYMTPNFRNELYKWQYDREKHGEAEDCIPMQLQLLFSKLQLSDSVYIETTGLTKSFQWDLRDSFQQHDVQEFCRVLFDAIEQSMEGTNQSNVINELYEGTYIDYVKCLNCNNESCREDKFLDISLAVRNDFDKVYNKSVEMALENFSKHEELTGENKYFCDNCSGKHDAIKGLKFKHLPKILVLQLKRFDLDISTLQRVKLNDKVTFPEILNMNPYVVQTFEPENSTKINKKVYNTKHFQDYANKMICQSQDKKPILLENFFKKKLSGDNSYFLRHERNKLIERYSKEGQNVYELYSIMIHSGSALGGHYYAYIKNFEDGKWYSFNDSIVSEITSEDIHKVYGGDSYTVGSYSNCSTNAYLLMYRRYEPEAKIENMQVPQYIIEQLEKDKNLENQEFLEREEKLKNLRVKVLYQAQERFFEIKKEDSIKAFTDKVFEEYAISTVSRDNVRLRGYSTYHEVFQEVFEDYKTVDESGIFSQKVLALEVKSDSDEFLPYDPSKFYLKVYIWKDGDLTYNQLAENPKIIDIEKRETVLKLMEKIQEVFGIPKDQQIIIRKSFNGLPEIISTNENYSQSLSYARIFEGTALFLEEYSGVKSKWQKFLEEEHGKITLKYNNPKEIEDNHTYDIFKHSISIDKQKSLLELKQELSVQLDLDMNSFIIKKSSFYGTELKDLSMTLNKAGLGISNQVFVELGQPSKTDEIRVNFQIALPPKAKDSDGAIYSVDNLFEMPVNINYKIAQVKELLKEELLIRYPSVVLDTSYVRFRYNSYTVMGKILNNKETVKDMKLTDRVAICMQILKTPERVMDTSDIIVFFKVWKPNTWEISLPDEIIINKNGRVHDLGQKISNATGIDVISI